MTQNTITQSLEKSAKHHVNCWLINTGWSGGACGVGERMDITNTRIMLNAAWSGQLHDVVYHGAS